MRKLLKSRKALSPVVAAIILIAVTVAVSIAVAAWMGSLTIGFMETTELTITNMAFDPATGTETITLSITNSGTSSVTISGIKVNGATIALTGTGAGTATGTLTYAAGASASDLVITLSDVVAGSKYAVNLFATDGTLIGSHTATA
jgi:flagellin-like protein